MPESKPQSRISAETLRKVSASPIVPADRSGRSGRSQDVKREVTTIHLRKTP